MLTERVKVSPRRWLFLPIGMKVRELDGSASLAFEAAERGWGVILANKNVILGRDDLPKGLQIEKGIAGGSHERISGLRALGRRVSAWCEEGLVYSNAREYGWRKVEREAFDLLDKYFAWGESQATDMVGELGFDASKMVLTGNPRFDLYRSEMRALFDERVARLKNRYAPFILINTKFSAHNGYRTPDRIRAKMHKLGKVETDEQASHLQGFMEFHSAGFAKFMELTDRLSRTFPDHTVVIRPHPAERLDAWQEKAAALPNVVVNCTGNVAEWILASDVSIHNNCTTGVETFLLGRTSISYRPVCDEKYDLNLPNSLSIEAFDLDTVVGLVDRALHKQEISNAPAAAARQNIARRHIASVEGKRASERILDAIDDLDLPEAPLAFTNGRLVDAKLAVGRGLQWLHHARGGRKVPVPYRQAVNKAEVLDLLHALRRATGRFQSIQVAESESNLLCVY